MGVAISATGQYILSCHYNVGAYLSNNSGSTFAQVNSLQKWSCAISGNGQYMLLGGYTGYIHRSTNYGGAFTENTTGSLSKNWRSMKMSYDGKYCLAASDFVYLSSDYGATFAVTKDTSGVNILPGYSFHSDIAMSTTGQYMISIRRIDPIDNIIISTDSGATWKKKTLAGLSNFANSCDMSADGQTAIIGSKYFDKLYKITNISADTPTITEITAAAAIRCSNILLSSDALYIFISDTYNRKMYYSTNGGSSFKEINTTENNGGSISTFVNFGAMAMTPDARIIIGNNLQKQLLYISKA